MLTCIARSKQPPSDHHDHTVDHPPPPDQKSNGAPSKQAVKNLSSQIKDMAMKASGAYRHCAPCAAETRRSDGGGEAAAERLRWSYRRTGSSSSNSSSTTAGRRELEARLRGISSGDGTPAAAASGRREAVVFVEESEPKEWVAQVEPGVLITFLSLPRGGNDLKRIRFSRDMFNKWQAQKWWQDNCEKVTELYNVQRLNRQVFPLPSTPKSEGENAPSKTESVENSPVTPPLGRERLTRTLHPPINGPGIGYSTSDHDSYGVGSTPKVSSISGGAKTELTSSSSMRTSSSRDVDRSGEMSVISNAIYLDTEWVEEDEPGVYITIRALPDGRRELRRVRFSREKYGEMHARVWWEENRARIHKQYL